MSDPLVLRLGLVGHSVIDYDKGPARRSLVKGAALIRKEARRLLSRRAASAPGEIPGQLTGRYKRAIGIVKKGSKGGWIKVGVRSIPGSIFYPAFLFYGVKRGPAKIERLAAGEGVGVSNRRRKGERAAIVQARRGSSEYRIAPRGNVMTTALQSQAPAIQAQTTAALRGALKPR